MKNKNGVLFDSAQAFRELGQFGGVRFNVDDFGGIGGSMGQPGVSGDGSGSSTIADPDSGSGEGGTSEGEGGAGAGTSEGEGGTGQQASGSILKADFDEFRKDFNQNLNALKDVLVNSVKEPNKQQSEEIAGIDALLKMDDNDLREKMASDPKGFIGDLVKGVMANVATRNEEQSYNSSVERTFSQYGEKDPTFVKMWEDGSIKDFMAKNPGHNAISAHMEITREAREKAIRDGAVKETTDKLMKDLKEKKIRQTLTGGVVPGLEVDSKEALKNTKKHGGAAAVIAARAGLL